MSALVFGPVLIPLVAATASLLTWQSRAAQRVIAVAGTAALLGCAALLLLAVWHGGIVVASAGGWAAPFGITFVADHFAAIMVALAGVVGVAVALTSVASIDEPRERFGYYPLVHVLLAGVCGAFLTGDVFNLFVWFEVMLLASFVLLALGGERDQMEGALKYVTLNLFSSTLFLSAVGILYGIFGTLNMADLAVRLPHLDRPGLVTTVAMLFLVSFGIKAAAFPLFFWLPASYHTPPVAVSALFAGLLTKVGVYALIRVFTLLFTHDVGTTHMVLLVTAALTMVTGVLGAAAHYETRRILSFHIVSQIGYMIMGLALFTPLALLGSVFYILHHIVVKTNLFLVSGAVQRAGGSFELRELGGLYRRTPLLALLFLVPALSLAGIPPLSGFFAKLILVQAAIEVEAWWIVAVALAVGLLTLYSMVKIWNEAFWKPAPVAGVAGAPPGPPSAPVGPLLLPIGALAAITVLVGLWAQPFVELSGRAAAELMDPARYIAAVLGVRP
ncbi:MAG: cation:proton antiporter [Myxococcales bacterium]